jgi:hypothetical protein
MRIASIQVGPEHDGSDGLDLTGNGVDQHHALATISKRNIADMGAYSTWLVFGWGGKAVPLLPFDSNRQSARIIVGELLPPPVTTTYIGVLVGKRRQVEGFLSSGVMTGGIVIPMGANVPISNNEELYACALGTPLVTSFCSVLNEKWRDVNAIG